MSQKKEEKLRFFFCDMFVCNFFLNRKKNYNFENVQKYSNINIQIQIYKNFIRITKYYFVWLFFSNEKNI